MTPLSDVIAYRSGSTLQQAHVARVLKVNISTLVMNIMFFIISSTYTL